jgi:hypothetical protein
MANVLHSAASGIHPGAYVQSTAPTSPLDHILWVDTSSGPPYALKTWNAGASAWQAVGTGAAAGSITYHFSALGAAVTMTTTPTFYSGPSVTCAAGTWALLSAVTVLGVAGAGSGVVGRIFDGSAAQASGQALVAASQIETIVLGTVQVIGGSTTFTAQAQSTQNNCSLRSATNNPSGQGNNATWILAIQLA